MAITRRSRRGVSLFGIYDGVANFAGVVARSEIERSVEDKTSSALHGMAVEQWPGPSKSCLPFTASPLAASLAVCL